MLRSDLFIFLVFFLTIRNNCRENVFQVSLLLYYNLYQYNINNKYTVLLFLLKESDIYMLCNVVVHLFKSFRGGSTLKIVLASLVYNAYCRQQVSPKQLLEKCFSRILRKCYRGIKYITKNNLLIFPILNLVGRYQQILKIYELPLE